MSSLRLSARALAIAIGSICLQPLPATAEPCALGPPFLSLGTTNGWNTNPSYPGTNCIDVDWFSGSLDPLYVITSDIRYQVAPWELWESFRVRSGETGRVPFNFLGVREDPQVPGLPLFPIVTQQHRTEVREIRLKELDFTSRFHDLAFGGDPTSITLDDASMTLPNSTLILPNAPLAANFTLLSNSGTNMIDGWTGSVATNSTITVMAGTELTLINDAGASDGTPLTFGSPNNALNVSGRLLLDRVDITLPVTAPAVVSGELVMQQTPTRLALSGDLQMNAGSVSLSAGSTLLVSETLSLAGGSVSSAGDVSVGTLSATGSSTLDLIARPTDQASVTTDALLINPGASLTCTSADAGILHAVDVLIAGTLDLQGTCIATITGPTLFAQTQPGGDLSIGSTARLLIGFPDEVRLTVKDTPVSNNGNVTLADGEMILSGTTAFTGAGTLTVRGSGTLLLTDDTPSATLTQAEVSFNADATLQLILNPAAVTAQTLVVNGNLTLGQDFGGGLVLPANLNLLLQSGSDVTLPAGNKLTLVNYSGTLKGEFDGLPEGQRFTLGANTFEIRYADGNAITLTVVDVDGPATFRVNKAYTDGATEPVEVTLSCNGGLPLVQKASISPGNPVTFTLTDFVPGTVSCEIIESDGADGYAPSYDNGSVTSATSCRFDGVLNGGSYTCEITNTPAPVDFEVFVEWMIGEEAHEGIGVNARVVLSCTGGSVMPATYAASPGDVENRVDEDGNPLPFVLANIVPPSTCMAEMINVGRVVETSGCEAVTIAIDPQDSENNPCLLIATAFFEGIPALDRNGLVMLVLLMLFTSLWGLRRMA